MYCFSRYFILTALIFSVACSDGSTPYTTDAGNKADSFLPPSDSSSDSTGGGTGNNIPTQVTECENSLPVPSDGACVVQAGDTSLWLMGNVMTPSGLLIDGHVVVRKGEIACVGCDCATQGQGATQVSCPGSLITPGLVNPHDHLKWTEVPPVLHGDVRYDHRNEWRKGKNGKPKLSTPQNSSGDGITYGELRMLMSGVTSIMGSASKDGLLRNLDSGTKLEGIDHATPDTPTFPLGDTGGEMYQSGCSSYKSQPNISSVSTKVAYVPHLAEGVSDAAHNEFVCMSGQAPGAVDAVFDSAAFIHGIGLTSADIALVADDLAGLIWSPRSNVSLYGFTADVTTYDRLGVQIALGTDWVPSGSMNMLREIQCVDYFNSKHLGGYFSDRKIMEMVTQNAAAVSGFGDVLGALQEGMIADVAVFDGRVNKLYRAAIDATPGDVVLVVRGGFKMYGDAGVIDALPSADKCDEFDLCGRSKQVCMVGSTGFTFDALLKEVHSKDTSYVTYPLYFCELPKDEPSCVPLRPNEFTGQITELDLDGDGLEGDKDNCPTVFNPPRPMDKGGQPDADGDKVGDQCDVCPFNADTDSCSSVDPGDLDADGIENVLDNCPQVSNPGQENADGDLRGDACDDCPEAADPCPSTIYAIKKGAVAEGTTVNLPPLVVTAVTEKGYFVQHVAGSESFDGTEYSGIFVYDAAGLALIKAGDTVSMVATVSAFFGQLQLQNTTLTIESIPLGMPDAVVIEDPSTVATSGDKAAAYEGVLIQISNLTVTDAAPVTDEAPPTNEFAVTGGLLVDDLMYLIEPFPAEGSVIQGLTGILYSGWNNSKLAPRGAADIQLGAAMLKSLSPEMVYFSEGKVGGSNPAMMLELTWPTEEEMTIQLVSLSPEVVIPSPSEVVIAAGSKSAEVTFEALGSSAEAVTIEASAGDITVSSTVRVVGADEVPVVSAIEPAELTLSAGKKGSIQIVLDLPAQSGGQQVFLNVEPEGVLSVPPEGILVPEGEFVANVDVIAAELVGTGTLTVSTDAVTAQVTATVTITEKVQVGLLIAELMYDPPAGDDELEWIKLYNGHSTEMDVTGLKLAWGGTDYNYGNVFLTGVIPAGGCFIVGGPKSDDTNGLPVLDQVYDFEPDIQNSGTTADGVALFQGETILDAVIYGKENSNGLVDESGTAGAVDVGKAPKGNSLIQTGSGVWGFNPTPNSEACITIE